MNTFYKKKKKVIVSTWRCDAHVMKVFVCDFLFQWDYGRLAGINIMCKINCSLNSRWLVHDYLITTFHLWKTDYIIHLTTKQNQNYYDSLLKYAISFSNFMSVRPVCLLSVNTTIIIIIIPLFGPPLSAEVGEGDVRGWLEIVSVCVHLYIRIRVCNVLCL